MQAWNVPIIRPQALIQASRLRDVFIFVFYRVDEHVIVAILDTSKWRPARLCRQHYSLWWRCDGDLAWSLEIADIECGLCQAICRLGPTWPQRVAAWQRPERHLVGESSRFSKDSFRWCACDILDEWFEDGAFLECPTYQPCSYSSVRLLQGDVRRNFYSHVGVSRANRIIQSLLQNVRIPPVCEIRMNAIPRRISICPSQPPFQRFSRCPLVSFPVKFDHDRG